MRRIDKKQAEDFVQLLKRAHEEIKRALQIKNHQAAMELLEECQSCVIRLGELIESMEGEETATIPLLEDYCELIYQNYEKIRQGLAVNEIKAYKILNKAVIRIENSIRNDIHEQIEAVFLPYKASMWDSLESIWKAADEDPNCDAYVIPIPYYDKRPDGSFGELHYELDQYPKYVPVMRYGDYDFEKRKPDIIFIHNPYDDCNYVTSVHPFFYSKNLKRLTSQLIYVPYFILSEINPDNLDEVKSMEHFCTVPGVIHADKVLVQSENMRKAYIKVLTDAMKEQGITKKYWEEKIMGIGSPKIDKVVSTRKEELEIPTEWMKIIEKPDGSWKKIILYNTSVGALLQHHERMLEKIQNVLQAFWDVQDDVALLWRPHPLMKATIESMCPVLWEGYRRIVEQYQAEKYGIYDESSDIDRAVVLCDAYYGDLSSVVQMCQKVGKTIMIQNVDVRT